VLAANLVVQARALGQPDLMRLAVLLCLLLLTRAAGTAPALPNDVYVWQLRWTPALGAALAQTADVVDRWHVLVGEVDRAGQWRQPHPDWSALAATGRPVVPVLRIDGQLDDGQLIEAGRAGLAAAIAGLAHAASAQGAGAMLEIDHDCATARLAGYIALLHDLRGRLPPGTLLSITALPDWLTSPDFPALAASADQIVLQVHAVQDPRRGLFDADRAEAWARLYARRSRTPFLLALPAYGARASFAPDGGLLAIEAETPRLADAAQGIELTADPLAVARLVARLRRDPPPGLRGLAWFRLPTTGDARAWSLTGFHAVLAGETPHATLLVRTAPGWRAGVRDIMLDNPSGFDVALPAAIALPPGCALADGIRAYGRAGSRLVRRQNGLLRGQQSETVGWMRCGDGEPHVEP
jgi:hypothetical protein